MCHGFLKVPFKLIVVPREEKCRYIDWSLLYLNNIYVAIAEDGTGVATNKFGGIIGTMYEKFCKLRTPLQFSDVSGFLSIFKTILMI